MKESTDGSGKVKPVRKNTVPTADIDLGNVVTLVSNKWKTATWLKIVWLTQAQFEANAVNYNSTLEARMDQGKDMPQISAALKKLDLEMDQHISYVKGYINDAFDKADATSYYKSFGIDFKNKKYAFPNDQNRRLASLKLMISGLKKHGLEDRKYGLEFWTALHDRYENLLEQSTKIDGGVSIKVGTKNVLKKELKKGLAAIIFSIKANYPDTFKQELRDWGFQKEKY